MGLAPSVAIRTAAATSLMAATAAMSIDTNWYPPKATVINDLDTVLDSTGVYGFIFNSSEAPAGSYGRYNWCNMPHVRKTEYVRVPQGYELEYVEVVSDLFGSFIFMIKEEHMLTRDSRSIVIIRGRRISPILSLWSLIPGIAPMRACSIMEIQHPGRTQH